MKQQQEPKHTKIIKALIRVGCVVIKSQKFSLQIEPIISRKPAMGGK